MLSLDELDEVGSVVGLRACILGEVPRLCTCLAPASAPFRAAGSGSGPGCWSRTRAWRAVPGLRLEACFCFNSSADPRATAAVASLRFMCLGLHFWQALITPGSLRYFRTNVSPTQGRAPPRPSRSRICTGCWQSSPRNSQALHLTSTRTIVGRLPKSLPSSEPGTSDLPRIHRAFSTLLRLHKVILALGRKVDSPLSASQFP